MNRTPEACERRVLVVEDDVLIAMEMEDMVRDCGCVVVGPVGSVAGGLEAVRQTEIHGAVLDVNLRDVRVWPVAELLEHQGIPFVLTTGYDVSEVPAKFRDRPLLQKPLAIADLQRALHAIGMLPE